MKKVVVIGGGVIGLTSAYFLTKLGMDVTVIEKEEFGMACSRGNQGWVCPAIHEPVPAPGLVAESLQMLMKKDSPLYIKPSAMPQLYGWLTQFMKYCNEKDFKSAQTSLLTISRFTLSLFEELQNDGVEFELHKKGILFLFLNEINLRKKMERFEYIANQYGHEQPVYKDAQEVKEMEPAVSENVVGGIFLDNQYHVRPETYSQGIVKKLKEMDATLCPNTEVIDVERIDNKIISVKTKNDSFEANNFLLSAGVWSDEIGKKIGYKLPLTAGKGYSITVNNPTIKINRPLYFEDLKAGITPFNNAVRMGGTMELSGKNIKMDSKRIKGIRTAASQYMKEEIQGETEEEWGGMRPMTPDGLPVLGKVPNLDNIYIASGHGMIGLALAPISGKVISELMTLEVTKFDIEAFSPDRFEK